MSKCPKCGQPLLMKYYHGVQNTPTKVCRTCFLYIR